MKKIIKRAVLTITLLAFFAGCTVAWLKWESRTSNPYNYETVGDIPTPFGYERIADNGDGYAVFLRSLKLKPRGSVVMNFNDSISNYQWINYAVIDMPLICNEEQCADCCMRLRAEYLFSKGQYDKIHFQNGRREALRYTGGSSHMALMNYLRKVYQFANTASLSREMSVRKFGDIRPGDIWVYPAPAGRPLGHAIMVADVAINKWTGKKALLLVEGSTPACEMHVVRNIDYPRRRYSWFFLEDDDSEFAALPFHFSLDNLRYFKG